MGNDKYAKIVFLWSCRKSKICWKWIFVNKKLAESCRLETQPVPISYRERFEARLCESLLLQSLKLCKSAPDTSGA